MAEGGNNRFQGIPMYYLITLIVSAFLSITEGHAAALHGLGLLAG